MQRIRTVVAMATAVVALAAVAGCSRAAHTVPIAAGSAGVARGETLVIEFGAVNPSIGDRWFLVAPPDAGVLVDKGEHLDDDCDQPGCGATLTWEFEAVGPGTTTVGFQYCYRSGPTNCQPRPTSSPGQASLTVTVHD